MGSKEEPVQLPKDERVNKNKANTFSHSTGITATLPTGNMPKNQERCGNYGKMVPPSFGYQ